MHQRIIVLVIDRLRPAFLGPYGNTWVETEAFNELAAQSLLAEQAFTESPNLAAAYRVLWSPSADADSPAEVEPASDLIALARGEGWHTTLLTDDSRLAGADFVPTFDQRIILPSVATEGRAADVESTPFAALMAQTLDVVERMATGSFLWVHARGLAGPWNAPYAWRQSFAAEEDPDPPTFVEPPAKRLTADVDPDHLWGLSQAYAAEIRVIDECLWPLVNQMDVPSMDDTVWVLTSTRGYPLGEHGLVGDGEHGNDESVFTESAHIPLLIRQPHGRGSAARTQRLCQLAGLREWLTARIRRLPCDPTSDVEQLSSRAVNDRPVITVGSSLRASRTTDWCLIRAHENRQDGDVGEKLFVRPDDAWEFNDVAALLPDTVTQLRSESPEDN